MKRVVPAVLGLLAACGTGAPPASNSAPTVPSFASMPPPADGASIPAPREPQQVVFIAGDVLQVSVYGQPDLTMEIRIPQDGGITYPLIGAVAVAGRTPAQLEEHLRERLGRDYLVDPQVTVTVKEYAKRKIYVLGGVKVPGAYDVPATERITILQLLASAGGFTDNAYKEYAQIVRRTKGADREVVRLSLVDVERAVAKGNAAADIELWPDDLVVVPSAQRVVYVTGAVKSPGQFDLPADMPMTVSMAVSRAGSWTKFASTGRVQVLRRTPAGETQRIGVDLDAVLNGRLELDAELRPGDIIYVPERGLF